MKKIYFFNDIFSCFNIWTTGIILLPYFENMQVINPAFAGSESKNEITLLNRNQWAGLSDSPQIMSISYSYKAKKNIGIGFRLFQIKCLLKIRLLPMLMYPID